MDMSGGAGPSRHTSRITSELLVLFLASRVGTSPVISHFECFSSENMYNAFSYKLYLALCSDPSTSVSSSSPLCVLQLASCDPDGNQQNAGRFRVETGEHGDCDDVCIYFLFLRDSVVED